MKTFFELAGTGPMSCKTRETGHYRFPSFLTVQSLFNFFH